MKTVYFLTYPFILLQFRDVILLLQSSENFSVYPLLSEVDHGGDSDSKTLWGSGEGGIQNDSTRNSFPHQCRPSLKRPTRPIHHCLLLHFITVITSIARSIARSSNFPLPLTPSQWQHNCGPWIPGNATPKRLPVSHSSTLSVSRFNKATLLPPFRHNKSHSLVVVHCGRGNPMHWLVHTVTHYSMHKCPQHTVWNEWILFKNWGGTSIQSTSVNCNLAHSIFDLDPHCTSASNSTVSVLHTTDVYSIPIFSSRTSDWHKQNTAEATAAEISTPGHDHFHA